MVIPPWIYRIPSELRSQAGLGLPSTVVGDHTGIVSAVCYNFFIIVIIFKMKYFIQFNVRGTREQNFKVERTEMKKKQFVFGLALGVSRVKVIRRVQLKRGRTEVLSELCS